MASVSRSQAAWTGLFREAAGLPPRTARWWPACRLRGRGGRRRGASRAASADVQLGREHVAIDLRTENVAQPSQGGESSADTGGLWLHQQWPPEDGEVLASRVACESLAGGDSSANSPVQAEIRRASATWSVGSPANRPKRSNRSFPITSCGSATAPSACAKPVLLARRRAGNQHLEHLVRQRSPGPPTRARKKSRGDLPRSMHAQLSSQIPDVAAEGRLAGA